MITLDPQPTTEPTASALLERLSQRAGAMEETLSMFTILVNRYQSVLYRIDFDILKNSADAEDALQDKFKNLIQKPFYFKDDGLSPSESEQMGLGWLREMDKHIALKMKTRNRTDRLLREDDPACFALIERHRKTLAQQMSERAAEEAVTQMLEERLRQTWPRLSERQQFAVVVRIEGHSYQEIALLMGAKKSQVRGYLASARKTLRRACEPAASPQD